MTEGKEGISKIEIAGAHTSPGELVRRAERLRIEDAKRGEAATPLIREIALLRDGMNDLTKTMQAGRLTPEQALGLAQKQTTDIAEMLGRIDPETERENWIDLEYRQEFWIRFEPRSWPRFYEKLGPQERRLWDARWQLARAAFVKKATAALPDKYAENQDLLLLGKDQMEVLYAMPGVRKMLEAYADVIAGNTAVHGVGSIWECKDQDDFESFRVGLRSRILGGTEPLEAKEADAVAWNLFWVSNLIESVDSRYSYSGGRHGDLPSAMVADEYRWVLHVQEKGETKWTAHHSTWGAFGRWGVTQIERIERQWNYDNSKDKFVFTPARKAGDYWGSRVKAGVEFKDEEGGRRGGRIIEILVPECYPTTSARSFLEETKAKGTPLLDYLLRGEEIPWQEVKADAWGIYVMGKFNKAVKFAEYYNPGKPMEKQKPGHAKEWAGPFVELLVRLEPQKLFGRIPERMKRNILYTLKFWAIFAAHDGVKDPTKRQPTLNLNTDEAAALAGALAGKRIGFWSRLEALRFLSGL